MDSFVFVDTSLRKWVGGVHTSLSCKGTLKKPSQEAILVHNQTLNQGSVTASLSTYVILGSPTILVFAFMMSDITLESTLTCPNCGHRKTEIMPTDACQYYYECKACHTLLKPNKGDCCVFCSFGSVRCPPIQEGSSC